MGTRTNFVKVENLPPGFSNGHEIANNFGVVGSIQDVTAVDPTTIIISYQQRTSAQNAVFALNGLILGGSTVAVSLYFNLTDPQFFSNPLYQCLGQYIGNDRHLFNPSTFQPWGHNQVLITRAAGVPSLSLPPLPSLNIRNPILPATFTGHSNDQTSNPQLGASSNLKSNPSTPLNGTIQRYTVPWDQGGRDAQCSICLGDLSEEEGCRSLSLCFHSFHTECLIAMLNSSPSDFLQCPTCKRVHGIRTGTRPETGKISHRLTNDSLPGHDGCGTIHITFQFRSGVQGQEHPNPGRPYTPHGFPRIAFLPDNPEGVRALHGLYIAWDQRLLFTVGRSLTTGMENCVTWNDIHLKTKIGSTEHGYPDPQYLANLAQDLAGFGITDAEISSHMIKYSDLRSRGGL